MSKKVDERQVQEIKEVGFYAFWIVFWYLATSVVVQGVFFKAGYKELAGEVLGLLIGGVTIIIGHIRKGVWDLKFKATQKTYVITSLIAAVLSMGMIAIGWKTVEKTLALYAIVFVVAFAICYGIIALVGHMVKRTSEANERKYDE